MVNKVILIGYLGKDPDVRYTDSGKAVCTFSLATSSKYGGKENTEWHRVVCWEKTAERCASITKGERIYVEGTLRYREYTSNEGVKRRVCEVLCRLMLQLSHKKKAPSQDSAPEDAASPVDDDLPF